MKWQLVFLCLALSMLAAPALAVEAVPFGGFSGLILGSPGMSTAEMTAPTYVALYALGAFGGPTEVGVVCEVDEAEPGAKKAPRGKFFVNVQLMRQNGGEEFVARLKMRLRNGEGEAARIRNLQVQPGDYLVFEFMPKKAIVLDAGQRLMFTGYAGAPGLR